MSRPLKQQTPVYCAGMCTIGFPEDSVSAVSLRAESLLVAALSLRIHTPARSFHPTEIHPCFFLLAGKQDSGDLSITRVFAVKWGG